MISKILISFIFLLYHWSSFYQDKKNGSEENLKLYKIKLSKSLIPFCLLSCANLLLIENTNIFLFNMLLMNFYFNNYEHLLYDSLQKDYINKKLENKQIIEKNEYKNEVYPL